MPRHIGELYGGFFPELERSRIVRSEIGVYRKQIRRYIRGIGERMISIQIFLERIVAIKIKIRSPIFQSEARNDFMLYSGLDVSGIYDSYDTDWWQ